MGFRSLAMLPYITAGDIKTMQMGVLQQKRQ